MADLDEQFALIRGIPGTQVERGLTPGELDEAESRFGVRFPPDLKDLLRFGLPTGEKWPHWRAAMRAPEGPAAVGLHASLAWPLEGMLFDVEHNSFWDPEWGPKPTTLAEAIRRATAAVRAAPTLVPVFAHRYLPDDPCIAGNPVLSVYQTDVIVYGRDLHSYFRAESGSKDPELSAGARPIRSWTRWMNAAWE